MGSRFADFESTDDFSIQKSRSSFVLNFLKQNQYRSVCLLFFKE